MNIQGIAASPGVAVGFARRVNEAPAWFPMNPTHLGPSIAMDSMSYGLLLQHLQRRIECLTRHHGATANLHETPKIRSLQDLWNDLWPLELRIPAPLGENRGDPSSSGNSVGACHEGDSQPVSLWKPSLPTGSMPLESLGISDHSAESLSDTGRGFIAIAESMTAADLRRNCREGAVGVILERCSWHSDTMLLARSMGIPLVYGLGTGIGLITDNMSVVVDGRRGVVQLPDSSSPRLCPPMVPDDPVCQPERPDAVPAVTRDGVTIRVMLSLDFTQSASQQLLSVADGIGLWRCGRTHWHNAPPTVAEFLKIYRNAAELLPEQELQIALCDSRQPCGEDPNRDSAGPDSKSHTVFHRQPITELSPRGWTVPQVQAISQLTKEHPVTILLSGIDSRANIESKIAALIDLVDGADRETLPFRIGVLVESPSAVLTARDWLPLAQSLTVDWDSLARSMAGLEDWQRPADPVTICLVPPVLRLLLELVELSRERAIPLTLCAHLLGNPELMAVALAVGFRRMSVSPWSFQSSQQTISQFSLRGLGELRHLLCSHASGQEITHWLREKLVR